MPSITTIITPLNPARVEACRQYLRANAEPTPDFDRRRLECRPLFAFNTIVTLHFCSFVILDEEDGFGPSLVFEATFDGARDDFLRTLLAIAPEGLDAVYRYCDGYPAAGFAAPDLVKEYLERHDVGAHTFFCGAPGRTVAQIKGEDCVQAQIAGFLAERLRTAANLPGRLTGYFEAIRDDLVRGRPENRWATQPAELPWEMTRRGSIVAASVLVTIVPVCMLGAAVAAVWPSLRPARLYEVITSVVNITGGPWTELFDGIAVLQPWVGEFISALRSALPVLIGVTTIWATLRLVELHLRGLTKHPRDQSFWLNYLLQIAVVLRSALVVFLVGSVLNTVVSGMENSAPGGVSKLFSVLFGATYLLVTILVLLILQHRARSLELMVELRPLPAGAEKWRRAKLDIVRYAMVLTCVIGLLAVARESPLVLGHSMADNLRSLLSIGFVILSYGVIGALCAYTIGFLLFLAIRHRELRDVNDFKDPECLIARSAINARKYAREEGGINTYQNHLVSLTYVKPGVLRHVLLRLALFAVNVLARFWFNQGELGGIPTILSARWVLIDGGKRLLFLDNFGGAWESYLNEFIDLPAVKGLNAIWSNTFVHAAAERFGFPATSYLFWSGAQAEQPFKAYVRQSQIETLVWYSAYPMLSVINVNANTKLRQSFSSELSPAEIDTVFQRI